GQHTEDVQVAPRRGCRAGKRKHEGPRKIEEEYEGLHRAIIVPLLRSRSRCLRRPTCPLSHSSEMAPHRRCGRVAGGWRAGYLRAGETYCRRIFSIAFPFASSSISLSR